MIYEYMLLPSQKPSSIQNISVANLLPDYHTYYSSDTNSDPFTLTVRTIDPYMGAHGNHGWRKRSTYHARTGAFFPSASARSQILHSFVKNTPDTGDHIGPFLTSTVPTTYRILLSPYTAHLRYTVPSLLALNRQIHAEASKVLYSAYTWTFHSNIESAVPFFSDLTPIARSHVRSVQITKKALPYTQEFDRAEWKSLCSFLSTQLSLRTLSLGVVAGRPGDEGWDSIEPITKEDFEELRKYQIQWRMSAGTFGGVDLEWADQLKQIKGLREVSIKAAVEHCPLPVSEGMRFWVAFSRSVECGFADWIRAGMVLA